MSAASDLLTQIRSAYTAAANPAAFSFSVHRLLPAIDAAGTEERYIRMMALAIKKQLSEASPRDEIDLDAVRSIANHILGEKPK